MNDIFLKIIQVFFEVIAPTISIAFFIGLLLQSSKLDKIGGFVV